MSDLDGTLLNPDAVLSERSSDMLERCIELGANITCATARTAATAGRILENLKFPVPLILMNGVCLYDNINSEYRDVEVMDRKSFRQLCKVIKKYNLAGFMFCISEKLNLLSTYYESLDSPNAEKFMRERVEKFGKKFTLTDDFLSLEDKFPVYYSISDRSEKLDGAYSEIKDIKGLRCEYYHDVYNKDFCYLEISDEHASKSEAVNKIRNMYNFEKVIGFGDNLNDLPLFECCDVCYAVQNACSELKKRADEIIKSNLEDGAAEKILESVYEILGKA